MTVVVPVVRSLHAVDKLIICLFLTKQHVRNQQKHQKYFDSNLHVLHRGQQNGEQAGQAQQPHRLEVGGGLELHGGRGVGWRCSGSGS